MHLFQTWQSELQLLAHVALAMGLGAAIGLEREFERKPAGLRTHMLVAGAASLLVGLSYAMLSQFYLQMGAELVRSDPVRVVEAVITGVSFLGAGTIIRGAHVEGLTTAASLLFAAGVGICVTLSQYILATGVTVLALLTLRALGVIVEKVRESKRDSPGERIQNR